MIETKIYVGLNDADTLEQKHDTMKYVSVLRNVCRGYHVPFSFNLVEGGYMHDDGRYTQEKTLVISLIFRFPKYGRIFFWMILSFVSQVFSFSLGFMSFS